jgi:peptidoglycan/LPS O-acetylase OafA/YrhL
MISNWMRSKFELNRHQENRSSRPMEGLRGLAIFLVFMVHFVPMVEPWLAPGTPLTKIARVIFPIGKTGVDLFFVLSGYLIYGSLMARNQNFLPFIKRRVQRIYPVFVLVFIVYIGLSQAFPSESKIPAERAGAILYLGQNLLLLPGLFPIKPLITAAWSLSYEMFYYLTIPLLVTVFRLRERSTRCRVYFFLAVSLGAALIFLQYGGPVRLLMFISGVLLYEVTRHRLFSAVGSTAAALALIVGLLSALAPEDSAIGMVIRTACLFVAFFMVCHTCFTLPTSVLARVFSFTPLRWLGNISYSYYLVHGLALKVAFTLLGKVSLSHAQGIGFFVIMMFLMFFWALIPSLAVFLLVERPFSLSPGKRPRTEGLKAFGSAEAGSIASAGSPDASS